MKFGLIFITLLGLAFGQKDPHWEDGRNVIVHMFEWPFHSIAEECENFLGPKGFAGVQTSPVNENLIVGDRPWWERYQPISYIIYTRSGDETAFRDMVARCNAVGVKVYVDVVLNHMTGNAEDAHGVYGSICNPANKDYPAVPYDNSDFHESCEIYDWDNPEVVWNCELDNLKDLDQSKEDVKQKIIAFLNHLIDCGVTGFRVDAAKHINPVDLEDIYSRLDDLKEGGRAYFYQEVPDYGDGAVRANFYTGFGDVTEFNFGRLISNVFRGGRPLSDLESWGPSWGMLPSEDALVFVDNHDNQRESPDIILTYKEDKAYKMAVAFTLAHTFGTPRIMSSYYFDEYSQGPPHDSEFNIIGAVPNAEGTCDNGWVCEHRWREITNMVAFRNAAAGAEITNWWSGGSNRIAFCRGNAAFVAFALGEDIEESLQTCLPAGTYCDVISGDLENRLCTGRTVTVDENGMGLIQLRTTDYDGVLALHINARQGVN